MVTATLSPKTGCCCDLCIRTSFAVGNGTFRRDLYFRVNVLNVRLPALRRRQKDNLLLTTHLLERISLTSRPRHL
jgi:transcriptional regulator with PAS, ATPase and Fis domain